jgi:hypothetical protein
MSELRRRFSVSRKAGYKWLHRYPGHGELEDRSRRPKASPKAVAESIEASIEAARKVRPIWARESCLRRFRGRIRASSCRPRRPPPPARRNRARRKAAFPSKNHHKAEGSGPLPRACSSGTSVGGKTPAGTAHGAGH